MSESPPPLEAVRYDDGTISYPRHAVGREGGEAVETIDLSERTARIVTWTTVTATPPGVRAPNSLAIVEFDVDGSIVRAIGQLTTDAVEIGTTVRPIYREQMRDPDASVRNPQSQRWDGYQFEPVSEG